MNEDLKWLAENVHQWPDGGEDVALVGKKGLICFEYSSRLYGLSYPVPYRSVVSFEEWKAARDELSLNHSDESTEKVWHGPEDGLPPVGTVLEAWFDDGRCCWHKAHVVGYHPSEANTLAISLIGDHESRLIWSDTSGIRPIRSEEDKAVEEMMRYSPVDKGSMAGIACQYLTRALYRAGYHKKEVK